jgi:hypothetical protein
MDALYFISLKYLSDNTEEDKTLVNYAKYGSNPCDSSLIVNFVLPVPYKITLELLTCSNQKSHNDAL